MAAESGGDENMKNFKTKEQKADRLEGDKPKSTAEGRTEAEEKSEFQEETMAAGAIDREAAKWLPELAYYHGFLPTDEVKTLLIQEGDYLLRLVKVDTDGGLRLVFSVIVCQLSAEKETRGKLKNMVISCRLGQYTLKGTAAFPTVQALVSHFHLQQHISRSDPISLKRAVRRQKWEFRHSDIIMGKALGAGQFGDVNRGILKRKGMTDAEVAIKQISGNVSDMMQEVRVMKVLEHPNVIRLYGVLLLDVPCGIVMEYCQLGSLDQYIRKHQGRITVNEKLRICLGTSSGVAYLNSLRIVHRDLAARNILYSSDKVAKVSDFGLSVITSTKGGTFQSRAKQKMPIPWLAPECLKHGEYSTKSDSYSLGVLFYEIFTDGQEPFDSMNTLEIKKLVTRGQWLVLPPGTPSMFRSYIERQIFLLDPIKRASTRGIKRFLETVLKEEMKEEVAVATSIQTKTDVGAESSVTSRSNVASRSRPTSATKMKGRARKLN